MNIGTKYRQAFFIEEKDYKILVYEIMYSNYSRDYTLTFIDLFGITDYWASTKPIEKDRYNIL